MSVAWVPSGGEGTRTLGLRLAKPPLFQLSYTPGAIDARRTPLLLVGVTIVGRGPTGRRSPDRTDRRVRTTARR